MAAVLTQVRRIVLGSVVMIKAKLAMDSSYPTGGEAITVPGIDTNKVIWSGITNTVGYNLEYLASTGKVKAWYYDYNAVADGAAIEVANTTDLSAITAAEIVIIGEL